MKDYTQRNFDKLCAALTMDELANFMDCIPLGKQDYRMKHEKLSPASVLLLCMAWYETPQGGRYWASIDIRLCANEA